jgi:hypothetical protein
MFDKPFNTTVHVRAPCGGFVFDTVRLTLTDVLGPRIEMSFIFCAI